MSDETPAPEPEPTEGAEMSQEEFAQALAERLAQTPVRDVIFQSMMTFLDMSAIRMGLGPTGAEAADLAQARQSIESARALMGVAERELGAAAVRPFKEPLAQLQMAYARVVEAVGEEGGQEGGQDAPAGEAGEQARPAPPPAGRPDPASRLWVPPGSR